ncbi:DUF6247 family protein [Streptomyces scabiei]|uniref:DUF6247 family protein n=1 Tax=Streptomyces scabiei TaxID=1930 RepID=UPI0029C076DD|nr:DUF6247 family protein [Streptomyces scabiei]
MCRGPRRARRTPCRPPRRRLGARVRAGLGTRALDDARHSFSLAPVHDVVRTWRARLASAPAVDAFLAGGCDDSDGIDLDQVLGART